MMVCGYHCAEATDVPLRCTLMFPKRTNIVRSLVAAAARGE